MGFTIFALIFGLLVLLCFMLTIYMFLRLVIAVTTGKEVPKWMYNIGQGFQGRIHIDYDDITESAALKAALLFFFVYVLANISYIGIMFYMTNNFTLSLYRCLKFQLGLAVISLIIYHLLQLILGLISNHKNKIFRLYSASNAVIAGLFISLFTLTLFVSMIGFPEKPFVVQIDKSNIIVGETKASTLLSDGFYFLEKSADSEIVNNRNDHFYYGELLEIFRDDKSYGFVSVTPTLKDSDKLKNCTITYYRIPADSEALSEVKFNNTDLSKLSIDDFREKDLTDIFSLHPIEYEEVRNDISFTLKIQTSDYVIWKRYSVEANFDSLYKPDKYGVRAQHTIWE